MMVVYVHVLHFPQKAYSLKTALPCSALEFRTRINSYQAYIRQKLFSAPTSSISKALCFQKENLNYESALTKTFSFQVKNTGTSIFFFLSWEDLADCLHSQNDL